MNYLLDTHTFLWWTDNALKLSSTVDAILRVPQPDQVVFLSVVSIWEIQIKNQIGKLPLLQPLPTMVRNQLRLTNLRLLPIQPDHIYALNQLPKLHNDPFDRLLAAQALHENLTLLTSDALITDYPIRTVW